MLLPSCHRNRGAVWWMRSDVGLVMRQGWARGAVNSKSVWLTSEAIQRKLDIATSVAECSYRMLSNATFQMAGNIDEAIPSGSFRHVLCNTPAVRIKG